MHPKIGPIPEMGSDLENFSFLMGDPDRALAILIFLFFLC
jgi:hypothetical protein